MNKNFIPVLIFLIAMAMIGLIAIQIYWINNSITLRDAQFRYNVKAAMAGLRDELQREETKRRMRTNKLGKQFFLELDSITQAKQEMIAHQSEVSTVDTLLDLGPFQLEVSNTRERGKLFKYNADEVEPEQSKSIEIPQNILSDSVSAKSISFPYQTEIIKELLSGLMALEFEDNFKEYYPPELLDSLIRGKLMEVGGIDTEFRFGVFDELENPEILGNINENDLEQLKGSDFFIRLFPNDFVTEPKFLKLYFPDQRVYLVQTLGPLLITSALLMILIIYAFAYSFKTIYRQKKLSEIKNDFINNMTHELKTPIATISLACEALSDKDLNPDQKRITNYVGMIREENKRLGLLVENVLRSAILDRGEMPMQYEMLDIHQLIKEAIKNINIQALQKEGTVTTQLTAPNPVLSGDRIHLTNMIYNLLDNAIKYTRVKPVIEVLSKGDEKSITLIFKDNGIGIAKDDQLRIFEKLYRVPTGDVHDIKGFGLGLSYVKVIVEKHLGKAWVESEPGKGSKFYIQLPLNHEE